AGFLSRKNEIGTTGRNPNVLRIANDFSQPRDILIRLVGLLCQHRNELLLDPLQFQTFGSDRLELLVYGEPMGLAHTVAPHECQITVGFDADEIRRVRYDGAVLSSHIAATFRLVRAHEHVETISPADETF